VALIECPECIREISDKAATCPNCGFPIANHLKSIAKESKTTNTEDDWKKFKLDDKLDLSQNHNSSNKDQESFKNIITIILGVVFFVVLVGVFISSYNDNVAADKKHMTETNNIRASYNNAKNLLNKTVITDDDLLKIKTGLSSVTNTMTEYTEAQKLLKLVSAKITEAEQRRDQKAKQESEENARKLKLQEEAGLNAKGKRLRAKHPDWSVDECDAISKKQIHLGMTTEQVAAAWGRPYHINRTTGSYGTHEQWVMGEMGGSYVYFENGICTTIQN